MAISNLVFQKFNSYLERARSILELGNQTFTDECIQQYSDVLHGYTNRTPVKNYCYKLGYQHVSIDITGLDDSLSFDLNKDKTPPIGQFDLVTNFGTTEHVEPNQYEPFLHIHNLCKINGIMIHEVPVFGHWKGHCKYYYDEAFFNYLSTENNYSILEMSRISYKTEGDLIFVALKKHQDSFKISKEDLVSKIKISHSKITIPEYWKTY
jgi:hypothetical protein